MTTVLNDRGFHRLQGDETMAYSNEELAALMDDSADVIGVDGWCQNTLSTNDGRVCLMGSMYKADGAMDMNGVPLYIEHPRVLEASKVISNFLDPSRPGRFEVADWNDKSGRTAGEVQDLLRTVAKTLREKKENDDETDE